MLSRETQALMEAAVDAVIVIDHRGHILAVNDAACRTFGFDSAEMSGANVSMLMPEPDRSAHDGHIARHLETGVARIIGIGREVTARRKDGSLFPARLSVGRVPESTPARFVGMIRDVTAEKEATAALELQRDRARAFLDLYDSILVELDAGRRIRSINSRGGDLLGAPQEEILGRDWLDFICAGSERERARLLLQSAVTSGSSREREFTSQDVAGIPRQIYWRCIALRTGDGAARGWLCSGVDVTERVEREHLAHATQERLTRVARLATMGELASGVAHEINQPLAAITTYAHACERYLDRPSPDIAELREVVREIGLEGMRAGEIIRRLRHLVRGEAHIARKPCDVNELIEELRTWLQSDARVHDTELRIALEPRLPSVVGNAVQLQQVVLNLVRNALEALGARPLGSRSVDLVTARDGEGDVEIRVADNGPGIDPAIATRLFDPFSTTKSSGTGLGLAISRSIVQSHGGSIDARGAEPCGAVFCVHLPAAEELVT